MTRRILALLITFLASASALAQGWPTKPVKVVVAFTAGGTTDIIARTVNQRLAERFKQQFVIENKPGAGGNIGTEFVVKAAPDGYTLIVNSVGPIAVNPTLYKTLSYNPLTDLVPIVQIADVPNVLVVPPTQKGATLDDFIAFAKANPQLASYGSTGIGTSSHLSSFMLAKRAGFAATHIPYKGADALTDLISGRVQFMFATIPSVIGQIRGGKLRAVAVSSVKRSRSLPDVPTVSERGFPGFEAGSWFGFLAPVGISGAIVGELNRAVNDILREPAIEAKMIQEGADPVGGTPEQFAAFMRKETEKWREVIRESGATAE